MKAFATLLNILSATRNSQDKTALLYQYLKTATDKDKLCTVGLLIRQQGRLTSIARLKEWCLEITGISAWLFETSYKHVGDLTETIGLVLPLPASYAATQPLHWYVEQLTLLQNATEAEKRTFIEACWQQLDKDSLFIFNKLITGGLRFRLSQQIIINAIAKTTNQHAALIAHRITEQWDDTAISFNDLFIKTATSDQHFNPYPFHLAGTLTDDPQTLGDSTAWQAEWKWNGIRAQLIKRNDQLYIWSRNQELLTNQFPELHSLSDFLPNGTVLDGQLLSVVNGIPQPASILESRIGKKKISNRQLQESPACFYAYDLLEWEGRDLRPTPLQIRREELEKLYRAQPVSVHLSLSPIIPFKGWQELSGIRAELHNKGTDGLMLKRKDTFYQPNREQKDWMKWEKPLFTVHATLIYAQKGSGNSNTYIDYTFAVRNGEEWIGFTKAAAGLSTEERAAIDEFIKQNTIERFGPVRTVTPQLMFAITFKSISASARHKSGVVVNSALISQWRKDLTIQDANTLEDLKKMVEVYGK